jgi:hypothetical protein
MRVVVLRTWSASCDPIIQSIHALAGIKLEEIVYNRKEVDLADLPAAIDWRKPDWVLMLGQCEVGGDILPSLDVLKEIGANRPFVHLCCDGSEEDWYPQLDRYITYGNFALNINIDGVAIGPIAQGGWTTLCPIDPTPFQPLPWVDRVTRLGFCGGWGPGHPRMAAVEELIHRGLINAVKRPFEDYAGYRDFLCSCKAVWNNALSGSAVRQHVKARVLETAYAGAVLFEDDASPARGYFDPGIDYVAYSCIADIESGLDWMLSEPRAAQNMAARMNRKAVEKYSAQPFWTEVLKRIGLG